MLWVETTAGLSTRSFISPQTKVKALRAGRKKNIECRRMVSLSEAASSPQGLQAGGEASLGLLKNDGIHYSTLEWERFATAIKIDRIPHAVF
jgi:hypothetical protein